MVVMSTGGDSRKRGLSGPSSSSSSASTSSETVLESSAKRRTPEVAISQVSAFLPSNILFSSYVSGGGGEGHSVPSCVPDPPSTSVSQVSGSAGLQTLPLVSGSANQGGRSGSAQLASLGRLSSAPGPAGAPGTSSSGAALPPPGGVASVHPPPGGAASLLLPSVGPVGSAVTLPPGGVSYAEVGASLSSPPGGVAVRAGHPRLPATAVPAGGEQMIGGSALPLLRPPSVPEATLQAAYAIGETLKAIHSLQSNRGLPAPPGGPGTSTLVHGKGSLASCVSGPLTTDLGSVASHTMPTPASTVTQAHSRSYGDPSVLPPAGSGRTCELPGSQVNISLPLGGYGATVPQGTIPPIGPRLPFPGGTLRPFEPFPGLWHAPAPSHSAAPPGGQLLFDSAGRQVYVPLHGVSDTAPAGSSSHVRWWPAPTGNQPMPSLAGSATSYPDVSATLGGVRPMTAYPVSGPPQPVPPPTPSRAAIAALGGVPSSEADPFGSPPVLEPQEDLIPSRISASDRYSPSALVEPTDYGGGDSESVADSEEPCATAQERRPALPVLALEALAELAPECVLQEKAFVKARSGLGADLPTTAEARTHLAWRESTAVSLALDDAESRLRGRPSRTPSATTSAPEDLHQQAPGVGTYLGSEKPLLSQAAFPFSYSRLSDKPLTPHGGERNLAGKSSSPHLRLTDGQLSKMEEPLLRALKAVSILESSLSGLVRSLRDSSEASQFALKQEIDVEHVEALFHTAARAVEDLASASATSLANVRLARRDLILGTPGVKLSEDRIRHLRSAPLAPGSLFAGLVPDIQKEEDEERNRALMLSAMTAMQSLAKKDSTNSGQTQGGKGKNKWKPKRLQQVQAKPKADEKPKQSQNQQAAGKKKAKRGGKHPQ